MRAAIVTTDNREHLKDYKNPVPHFGTAPAALLQGLAGLPELEVNVVSCARRPMISPEKLGPNIWFHSVHVPKIGWMRTAYQGCIRAVRKKLREIQPDIVHGQGTELDCALDAVFSGFPNVVTIHGNMRSIARLERRKPFSFGWLAARLETFTIPRSRGVVCITNYTRQAVADLAKRTWLVPNAVDPTFFEIAPQPRPGAPPRILCVGHVSLRKNQNAFVRSLDALTETRKFDVVFLGNTDEADPYDREFLRLVSERKWCAHAGFAGREALKDHFRQASVLALPSLEDNCPMVVLEAMAAGVPVVAAKVGGVPDLFEDGKTGWFCDPQDAASMRAGIEKVLANPAAAAEMAGLARQWARERFHPKVIAQRHVEIYRDVLGRKSSS